MCNVILVSGAEAWLKKEWSKDGDEGRAAEGSDTSCPAIGLYGR